MKKTLIGVALLHILGWGLLASFGNTTLTIGTGIIAYMLGVRHAFDADHLIAIDSTTRKLIHQGKEPHNVGFFFSLGHSTIVFIATTLAVIGIGAVGQDLLNDESTLKQTGSFIGSLVAGSFLILLAIYNMYILYKIITNSTTHTHAKGFWTRFMKPVSKAGHMYPIGILFGLGFDTATSVTMLSLSVIGASSGQLSYAALALPIIFTSGMALGDSTSGYLMSKAMTWANSTNKRKAYNITLTSIAIIAALAIGIPILTEL